MSWIPIVAELGGTLLGNYLGSKGDFSGGGEGSINNAQDYIRQMYGEAKGEMQPYEQAGRYGLGKYIQGLQQYSDPTKMYSQIMQNYQMSPGAQSQQQEVMNQLQNAMESRGLAGSGQEGKDILKYSQGLYSQDANQYLGNILGMNQQYLSGMGGLGQMGYGAAGQLGNYAMQSGGQMGGLATALANAQARTEAEKAESSSGLGGLIGGGASELANLL